jgi:hypothetical protein
MRGLLKLSLVYQKLAIVCVLITLSGCAGVTVTQSGKSDFQYRPQYQESKYFFLWGLIGEHHINVREICQDKPVRQMHTKFTGWDVLWGSLTLGLYLPRTAMVWCQEESN